MGSNARETRTAANKAQAPIGDLCQWLQFQTAMNGNLCLTTGLGEGLEPVTH